MDIVTRRDIIKPVKMNCNIDPLREPASHKSHAADVGHVFGWKCIFTCHRELKDGAAARLYPHSDFGAENEL